MNKPLEPRLLSMALKNPGFQERIYILKTLEEKSSSSETNQPTQFSSSRKLFPLCERDRERSQLVSAQLCDV